MRGGLAYDGIMEPNSEVMMGDFIRVLALGGSGRVEICVRWSCALVTGPSLDASPSGADRDETTRLERDSLGGARRRRQL